METNLSTNITLAVPTTTTCLARPGVLVRIVVNKATASGVITVYDGDATGTVKATITNPATLLKNQFVLDYDIYLKKGLTVVTSAAAQDITVVYRPA